jgi:hypothetical protein
VFNHVKISFESEAISLSHYGRDSVRIIRLSPPDEKKKVVFGTPSLCVCVCECMYRHKVKFSPLQALEALRVVRG